MIKYITPVTPRAAAGLTGDVYAQMKHDFGALVDPFVLHSISPPLLAAVWGAYRESVAAGVVPREIKEALAVTVSTVNNCPYCADAHLVMLHAAKAHSMARALVHDRPDRLSARSQAIYEWASATGKTKLAGLALPFTEEEAPEMIGTAVFFHYMNRLATVLLDDTPLPSSRRWMRQPLIRIGGWFFSSAAGRCKTPGASLAFLPGAELPEDLAWASCSHAAAGAWARLAREIAHHGQAALPNQTIRFVCEYLQNWEGEPAGTTLGSVEDALAQLRSEHQNSARLAILTAVAPHHVDENIVRAFADPHQEQERLLGALSWASFTAARRIGSWLAIGAGGSKSYLESSCDSDEPVQKVG